MTLDKVVLRELEDDCEQSKQLVNDLSVNVSCETLNLWSMRVDNLWVGAIKLWDEFWDVVDLSVIKDSWADLL